VETVAWRNCTSWDYTDGLLKAGTTTLENTLTESDLRFNADLIKPGTLRLKYKKNTKIVNEYKNGIFMVVVNDEPVLYNDDIDKDGWQNFEAGLLEGFNQISVIYRFYSYDDVADM